MSKVFISYSSADRSRAEDLCRSLELRGVECWIAPRNIPPGAAYSSTIVEAIDKCAGLVVLISENSNVSSHVAREVERAASKSKGLFPIFLANVTLSKELEYFLLTPQSIDMIGAPFDRTLDNLANALRPASVASVAAPISQKANARRYGSVRPLTMQLILSAAGTLVAELVLNQSEVTRDRPLTTSELVALFLVLFTSLKVLQGAWRGISATRSDKSNAHSRSGLR